MVDLQFIFYCLIGAGILAAIALIGSNYATIASIVSGQWRASLERARQQKAARERLYGYADLTSSDGNFSAAGAARSGATGDAAGAGDLLRGQQHQVSSNIDSENAAERASIVLRQLPKVELITMLAVQRKDDGSYLWSSNEIKKFVPGADGPIGEVIATVRGKKETPPPAQAIQRPVNGW